VRLEQGPSVALNVNGGLQALIEHPEFQWAWLMGDDHAFASDTLLRLLAHDRDIIVPLVVHKKPPYAPVLYTGIDAEQQLTVLNFVDFPPAGGLVEVFAAGSAGLLLKRAVVEKLNPPWMEYGRIASDRLSEDLWFCMKAREAGFAIWADLDTGLDHSGVHAVKPWRTPEGKWGVQLLMGGEMDLRLTLVTP